jgi:hypothetical protein
VPPPAELRSTRVPSRQHLARTDLFRPVQSKSLAAGWFRVQGLRSLRYWSVKGGAKFAINVMWAELDRQFASRPS